jgi:cysteinyl-tRNA synthetase
MSWKHLGETFDIHGGGIDLVFPHHENEIAQSRCSFHTPVMANYWMHNGFLQVEGEKMSKSLGNFVTMRELLGGWKGLPWAGDAIRFAMLMTHYAQPMDWTTERLAIAGASHHRFLNVGVRCLGLTESSDIAEIDELNRGKPSDLLLYALYDDLNTPAAIAHLYSLAKEADQMGGAREEPARQLLVDCLFLGLDPFRYLRDQQKAFREHRNVDDRKISELIDARTAARKAKNFAESDRIRDELLAMGVVLKDSKEGTTWELAR